MAMFKNFLRDVYRPMQLQAKSRGLSPADVDISSALNEYIGSRANEQVRADTFKSGVGLAERRLGLAKDQLSSQKKIAPLAIGLSAIDTGVRGLIGAQERTANVAQRKKLMDYIEESRLARG